MRMNVYKPVIKLAKMDRNKRLFCRENSADSDDMRSTCWHGNRCCSNRGNHGNAGVPERSHGAQPAAC